MEKQKANKTAKPKYNIWQNSVYVIKNAWARDKSVLFAMSAQIFLTPAISVAVLFLPKTVVAQIISGANINTLIITVLAFTAVTVILQSAKNYIDSGCEVKKWILRTKISYDILTKDITTDYANLEDKKYSRLKQKSAEETRYGVRSTGQIYNTFTDIGINLLGFAAYMILLVSVNPLVLLITAITTVFGVIVRGRANKWVYDHQLDADKARCSWGFYINNGIARDYLMAKDIRIFAMTGWIKDIYNACVKFAYDFNRRAQTKLLIADIVDCAAAFMREGIAYAYLIWQVLHFGLAADNFVLMFAAIGGFSGWIAGILNNYSELYAHSLNYCFIREYLEYPSRFKYDDGEPIAPEKNKSYSLELRNVSFCYSGAAENTLENINLTIKAGEKLAVVGLNGAGKTTLVKLLCGFYDPDEGEILLNGKDIREYNRTQYYNLFTAVFQDFNILPVSIAENISQRPNQESDSDKIKYCLEMAGLDEKINSLPGGAASSMLERYINDDAVQLSGGETQKLMLARAI